MLSNLGIVARFQNDFTAARSLYEESLQIRRGLGDRWAIANSLNNLGLVLRFQGDLATARSLLEESLAINRQVGDPWAIANSSYKRERHNKDVTEIEKIAGRGHSLTIDHGWKEVAEKALAFVKRFV